MGGTALTREAQLAIQHWGENKVNVLFHKYFSLFLTSFAIPATSTVRLQTAARTDPQELGDAHNSAEQGTFLKGTSTNPGLVNDPFVMIIYIAYIVA